LLYTTPPTTQLYTLSLHDALPISILRKYFAGKRPGTLLFKSRSGNPLQQRNINRDWLHLILENVGLRKDRMEPIAVDIALLKWIDRKSTRLNSSHLVISYAVFCLK